MSDEQLVIFVKAPRPGAVKTRLAAALGPEEACAAYCRIVHRLLQNLNRLAAVQLRFSPDDSRLEIQRWLQPGWTARAQGSGDLGARMASAFAEAFADRVGRVVIIGSDCPAVTAEDIRQAWSVLREKDVVLGPAADGGYWLIGLRRPAPQLFEGIAWSSERVLAQTVERLGQSGLQGSFLRTLTDVDTEESWRAFVRSQSAQ